MAGGQVCGCELKDGGSKQRIRNPKTKSCKISNKKDNDNNVMIGTSSYPTVEEAKKAKNAAPECKEAKKK